jgi:hypothetical protein
MIKTAFRYLYRLGRAVVLLIVAACFLLVMTVSSGHIVLEFLEYMSVPPLPFVRAATILFGVGCTSLWIAGHIYENELKARNPGLATWRVWMFWVGFLGLFNFRRPDGRYGDLEYFGLDRYGLLLCLCALALFIASCAIPVIFHIRYTRQLSSETRETESEAA